MKPYLESVRRISRTGLVLFALTVVASAIVAIQYCTTPYHDNVPGIEDMFLPLIVFVYIGGIVLSMDGFSFLNKRSDSDYYHSLPVSRKRLFWSVSLAALTWIAATVLAGALMTTTVFIVSKTPFVPLYPLFAVLFYIVAAMLVFSAGAIAMSLTGTILTGFGLTVLVLGLFRFIQFAVARGIVANAVIINWLDLPWFLTPVTNIATGQIAQLLRPMLRHTLYAPVNIAYSALLAGAELIAARILFARRPSELAERGAKNSAYQTVFACLAVIPVLMLLPSGVVWLKSSSFPIVIAVAVGIYLIYQIIVLRTAKKVLRSLPWLLVPLAIGAAGYFGTAAATTAMQNDIPRLENVAYVRFDGDNRGVEQISYQQHLVSQVRFTEKDVKEYALDTLADNVVSIRQRGYVYYEYDEKQGYLQTTQPVTFVLNNGRTVSRVLTFLNRNTLLMMQEENSDFVKAIRSLPSEDSVRYLQGDDPYKGGFMDSSEVLRAYYDELPESGMICNESYKTYDPYQQYNTDGDQNIGSISMAGYIGMTRYWDYHNIRLELRETSSAWMKYQNGRSQGEYLDLMCQMLEQSDALENNSDYFSINMMFYNVPMSDGTRQTVSFYYDRSSGDDNEYNERMQPLMNELAEIMLRSEPTIDPDRFFVYTNWSGRVHKADGSYYGEDILANMYTTDGDSMFVSGGSVYYVSNGDVLYYGVGGAITSFNPCYRAFSAADEARVLEILQQWQDLQKTYLYGTIYEEKTDTEPSIGDGVTEGLDVFASPTPMLVPMPTPTPTPVG